MSFFDDASLAFLPSGEPGKDGKAYSIKPTDGTGDFTFSRGSNLTATRVGPSGLIEKGRENLLTQSNNFTAWNLNNVTSGHAGYDGTNNAWLQSGTSRLQRNVSLGTSVYTGSVYVKAGFSNYVQLYIVGSSNALARFELTGNGTIVNSGGISPKIEPVSGATGWYRISTNLNGSITTFRIYPQNDSSGTQTADSSVYVQDAQLELGLAATDYIETGASPALAGILEDEPRFDYSGGATCPSLLLEPSRTQLIPYTEYFEGTGWSEVGSLTLTTNTDEVTSPEGVNNATLLTSANATSEQYLLVGSLSTTSGQDYTLSIIAKKKDFDFMHLKFQGMGGAFSAGSVWFNIATGAVATEQTGKTGHIKNLGNGWYKCSATATATGTASSASCCVQLASADNTDSVTGDGSSGTYIYGAGFEQSSYPTSYIPNHSGTTGAISTRVADDIQLDPLDQTYGDETTWFFELERIPSDDELNQTLAIIVNSATGVNNRFTMNSTSNGRIRFLIYDNTGTSENVFSTTDSFVRGTPIKVALKLNSSGASLFVNGADPITSSTLGTITGIDRVNTMEDTILKQMLVFPEALSDADCKTLTT